MKKWICAMLAIVLMLTITACKAEDSSGFAGDDFSGDGNIQVQFDYKTRYSVEADDYYVIAGEYAKISTGYNILIIVPKKQHRKFKVVIEPKTGAEVLEGYYETNDENYDNSFKEHVIDVDDLKHIYKVYSPELEATCRVYDITDGETLIFEESRTAKAVEARRLELVSLDVGPNVISAEVTHYPDMRYEWRMNKDGDLQLEPSSGTLGWSSEGFILYDDTDIGVTLYDELGRLNTYLSVYSND